MSLYLPVVRRSTAAIAICPRCQIKVYYSDLKKDPNNGSWYCEKCVDLHDPWLLPARRTENISLNHPRPDVELDDV